MRTGSIVYAELGGRNWVRGGDEDERDAPG